MARSRPRWCTRSDKTQGVTSCEDKPDACLGVMVFFETEKNIFGSGIVRLGAVPDTVSCESVRVKNIDKILIPCSRNGEHFVLHRLAQPVVLANLACCVGRLSVLHLSTLHVE